MTNLFLYGTLRHPGLLALVAGDAAGDLALEPARLDGFRVSLAQDHDFPLIEEAPGAAAEGLLLRAVTADMRARLDFYELGFGYGLREVTVAAADGPAQALIYVPRPGLWQAGGPFSLDEWVREHWPLTRHAAAEMMGYFGRMSGEEVAGLWRMIRTRAAATLMAERDATPCTVRAATRAETVEVLDEAASHIGYFLLKTLALRHPRFDGRQSEVLSREVFMGGDAVIVLPYDPPRERVLLVEQFRMGPFARGDRHPWQLEPVAGRIDAGETPEACALRETREETGLTLARLEPITRVYATPGYSSEVFHCFLGIADLPDEAAGLGGEDAEHEDIRSHVLEFDRAMALVDSGEANNGPLVLALLWLQRERDRLQAGA